MQTRITSSKNKYFAAGVATLIVFVLGILLGIVIDQKKYEYVTGLAMEQEVEFNSLQVQYLYLDNLDGPNSCKVIEQTLENNLRMFQPILERLIDYEENKQYNNEYELLKRKYLLANIRYDLLAQRSKAECGTDLVRVLYFYNSDCKICGDQGFLLSNLKDSLEDKLLVFPIDMDFTKEPILSVLSTQYDVTKFPTLVIEDTKYTGFQDKAALISKICPLYKEKTGICA